MDILSLQQIKDNLVVGRRLSRKMQVAITGIITVCRHRHGALELDCFVLCFPRGD